MTTPRFLARVAVAALVAALVTGCGNAISYRDVGSIGVSVDGAGRPVLVIAACVDERLQVSLSAGRTPGMSDDEPNRLLGEWTQTAARQPTRLVLADPGGEWTPASGVRLPETLVIAEAGVADNDTDGLGAVSFTATELDDLVEGEVLTSDGVVRAVDFGPGCP